MSGPPSANIDALLLPISDQEPAGAWLRYEPIYAQIQAARKEDDATLSQGVWKTEPRRANWREVERLCEEALRTRSKDLQLAAWLTEAWVQSRGFGGLRDGLRLMRGLCERFWDCLYPLLGDNDTAFRVTPLLWADQRLALLSKFQHVTRPEGGGQAYAYADWEVAMRNEKAPPQPEKKKKGAEDEATPLTTPRYLASAGATPRAHLQALSAALFEIMEEIRSFEDLLKERLGSAFITLHDLKKVLPEIQHLARQLLGAAASTGEVEPEAEAPEQAAPAVSGGGPIRSRAQAYQRLIEASEFLLRTEPHSPVPYLIKRAISWGNLGLTDLLAEIVGTPADLKAIYALLGVKPGGEK